MFFSFRHAAGLKPLKRPSLYIWPGYNITFCLKIYSRVNQKVHLSRLGGVKWKAIMSFLVLKSRQGEGGGSKMETFEQIYFLNGPPISYIFQLFHHLFFRNRRDTHSSLSIFARNGRWGTCCVGNVLCEKWFQQ